MFDWIKGLFKKEVNKTQALISVVSAPERLQALEETISPLVESRPVKIQKESLELGVAAGYFGQSIRHIESSLNRIESGMVTKDWMSSQSKDTSQILEILRKHEDNEQKRFEIMQNTLFSMQKTADFLPEPQKKEILTQIRQLESQFPLTPKMEQILLILQEIKQISYEELSQRLEISTSGLRSILTTMSKRTNKIQRFEKDGKGWIRFIENTA